MERNARHIPSDSSRQPPFPRRMHYAGLAAAMTLVALYGSLVPFEIRAVPWHEALVQAAHIPYLEIGIHSRSDWVANILLFVPLGFLWLGTFTVDSRGWLQKAILGALVVIAGIVLSASIEFAQIWFEPRTVSLNDVIAEGIGAVLGVAIWIGMGQTVTHWVRRYTQFSRPNDRLNWLLEAYAIGFVIYSLLPLDLTISVGELVEKYRHGRITLVPLSDLHLSLEVALGIVRDIIACIPLGMLLASWLTPASRPSRSLPVVVGLSLLAAAAIEGAQVVVYTRFASTSDILFSATGMVLGAELMLRWRGWERASLRDGGPWWRTAALLAVSVVYALIIAVVFCVPFDRFAVRGELRDRYEMFWNIPFAAMYYGSEFNAVSQVLEKTLLFAPLGTLLVLSLNPWRATPSIRRMGLVAGIALCAAWATVIEMVQVFLPHHVPDITDVLLGTIGAAVAAVITGHLTAERGAISSPPIPSQEHEACLQYPRQGSNL